MIIEEINTAHCKECNMWKGSVREKYNGIVPVHCSCTLSDSAENGTRSPSMISPYGDKFYWTPISEYKAEDGYWYHVAHFAGPSTLPPKPKNKK